MLNYFPSNLTFLRKLFKVTQASLALHLTKGQSSIGNWENDLTEPSVGDLLTIKHFFGISLDDLIETDLRNVKANELSGIIKKPGIVEVSVEGNVKEILKKNRNYTISDTQPSMVNEDDPTTQWATMKILKLMDEKLDRLLFSAHNKPDSGGA